MDNIVPIHRDAHREAVRLLPWLVSDTLEEDERAVVEAHLAECAECRAELDLERRLAAEIAALPTETAPAWAAMLRRLEPSSRRRTRKTGPLRAAKAALPWVGWAIAAQILLVIGLQTAIPSRTPQPPIQTYHALAASSVHPSADVAVIFRPRTTEAEIRSILQSGHARLADGPTAAGAWLLSIPVNERDASLQGLRARPEVLVAEPVDPVGP